MIGKQRPERRMMVVVDVERYSRRGNVLQCQAQDCLRWAMTEAVRQLGLDYGQWVTQPSGDGQLAILPIDSAEPPVVARLAAALNRLLGEYNRSRSVEARVRIRIALHVGLVHVDGANGFPGDAVVHACRLVNAKPLKDALAACPSANVAQIVSNQLYEDVILNRYDGIRPERYLRVMVDMPDKGFRETAWMTVPDEDLRGQSELGMESEPIPPRSQPPHETHSPAQGPGDTYHVGAITTTGPVVFGRYGRATETESRSIGRSE